MVYWLLKSILVGPVVRLLWRPRVEGLHHVPTSGGAIFASNHLSFSDSIFLPLVVPRRITFPAKMEYFTGTGLKGWATKMFFTVTGQIPIDRSGGEASMTALRQGLKVLRRGELFGIYPEGTRSPDGRLYKGKTGVARMALEAGVPVIPVAMIDTDKAQPTGQKIPNLHPVGVRIGRPLDFSRYEGMEEDRYVLRSITDEVMDQLAELSGKPYVDEYAATIKDRLAARARATVDQARAGVDQARGQVRDTTQQVAAGLSQRFTREDEDTGDGADQSAIEDDGGVREERRPREHPDPAARPTSTE
jgi:1-acyl-sn-glycerol-3-phosphate acyltransferase